MSFKRLDGRGLLGALLSLVLIIVSPGPAGYAAAAQFNSAPEGAKLPAAKLSLPLNAPAAPNESISQPFRGAVPAAEALAPALAVEPQASIEAARPSAAPEKGNSAPPAVSR